MQDGPPPEDRGVPTAGDPIGGHRVLEPPSVLPATALRLDAHPDLWDREVRVEVTDVVLAASDHLALQRQAGGDAGRMRAALLEASAERGGLPLELGRTSLVGRIAARGPSAPSGPGVGERVVLLPPVAALPLWLRDVSGWTGGRRIPVAGHAVAAARTPLVPIPDDLPPEAAVALARAAHVPTAVRDVLDRDPTRILLLGPTSVEGAAAGLLLAAAGPRLTAVVTALGDARIVRALGGAEPVLVASPDTREGTTSVSESLGGAADVVVVADADIDLLRIAAAAVSTSGRMVVLVPDADLDAIVLAAAGVGSSPSVELARRLPDGSADLLDLRRRHGPFRALVDWRSGLAPAPEGATLTADDHDPEET